MPRLVLLAALLLLACNKEKAAEAAPPPPPSTNLEARLREAILAIDPKATITTNEDHSLKVKSGSASWVVTVGLDNIQRSCANGAAACDDAIDGMVRSYQAGIAQLAKKDTPVDPTSIRLTLKDAQFLASADQQMKKTPDKYEENKLVVRDFAADIHVVYVIDEPERMMMVSARQLKDLKLTPEELHATALKNLATAYPKLTLNEIAPGVWTMEPGDYYDSARLALTDQWAEFQKKVGGKLVASAPARARVFVVDARKPENLEMLAKVTKMAFEQEDHALSPTLLEWTGKGWKPYRGK